VIIESDPRKEMANFTKHAVDFSTVETALSDPRLMVRVDDAHRTAQETRYYGTGHDGQGVLTVRFTVRGETVRVFGAGYWRKQRKDYENQK
jgi:uncharacterized protein